jgi:protocatechuate 3,4-dioxygenase beta subunit
MKKFPWFFIAIFASLMASTSLGSPGSPSGPAVLLKSNGTDMRQVRSQDDPVLSWNTFLGGGGADIGYNAAVDGSGNVYVAGGSGATWGTPIRAFTSSNDAFVAKLDADGNLVWSTFLGGNGSETAHDIALDGNGNIYVTGWSNASWGTPIRGHSGDTDAFAAKLDAGGNLVWNTFLGNFGNDYGSGIAAYGSGNTYVAGWSAVSWGTPKRAHGLDYDGFAAKLGPDGALTWNTFLGGNAEDCGFGMAVDGGGNAYVTGRSYSTWGTPKRAYTAGIDAFTAKLDNDGNLGWNTFLGGGAEDQGGSLGVDGSGHVYVMGVSYSTWGSPIRAYSAGQDTYTARLDSDGNLTWNTFLGGAGSDQNAIIAVVSSGESYVTGYSSATWGSPISPYTAALDGYAAKLDADGGMAWNTFLGGAGNDYGQGIAVVGSAYVYVSGYGSATWGSPITAYTAGNDAWMAKIVTASLTVTSPNGGEDWVWGSANDITWTSSGVIANVKIEYSTDNGANWTTIIASTPNDGSHSWTVPTIASSQCLVRVSDASTGTPADASDGSFSIIEPPRSLTVYAPNGGENWMQGSAHTITWGSTGTIANVKIEYSRDNGANWFTIVASRPNTGAQTWYPGSWTDPAQWAPSSICLVRISDASNSATFDVSDSVFTISDTGLISGTITDLSGTPIQDVTAQPYTLDDVLVPASWLRSDAAGHYKISGLATGSYKVLFQTNSQALNYLPEWYNDKGHFSAADPVAVTVGSETLNINAQLGSGGIISGRVTDESGAGLAGVYVGAWSDHGCLLYWTATSDAAGYYQIRGVPAGSYSVLFSLAGYPRKFSGNGFNPESAALVAVSNGVETPNVDAVMETGGQISGRVTDGAGNPVSGIQVIPYDAATNRYLGTAALTAADGTYTYIVRAGLAKILFDASLNPTSGLRSQFYSNQGSHDAAGTFSVVKGGATANIDAVLTAGGGTLTINVTNSLGQGIPATIYVYDALYRARMKLAVAGNAANGYLQIKGLLPGNYKLQVFDANDVFGQYDWQWFDNVQAYGPATAVNVTEGGDTPVTVVLNGTTPPANTLTVTSPNGGESWVWASSHDITWTSSGVIANVKIEYSTDNGSNWATIIASTTNDGSYSWTVPYAASTQCLIRVSDASTAGIFDVSNAVFNIRSDITEPNNDPASAAVLTLGTTDNLIYDGPNNQDIDWYKFFVPPAEAGKDLKVNVHVTSPYPNPIPAGWRSDIDFEFLDGALAVRGITMSGSDNETLYLPNVASGWYHIYIGYCTTNYDDASGHARYSVTLETGTGFGLGYLHGRVVDGDGVGIPQVFLTVYHSPADWNTCFPSMTTGPGGYFTIGVVPGAYDVQAAGKAGGRTDGCKNQAPINVVPEYYNDKKAAWLADHLTLSAGQTLNLDNIALDTGAIVTGRVTDGSSNPLPNIFVGSYDSQGNSADNLAVTNANGEYMLDGVQTGGAKIRFSLSGWLASEYYNDKPTFGLGELLPTVAGGTIPNINAQMTPGGTISGTVKDGGTGLAVSVRLFSVLDETWSRASLTSTAGTGIFNFYNVKPGDYRIFFNAAAAGYTSEWWADAGSFASATTVSVMEGGTVSGIDAQLAALAPEINLKQGATGIATGGTYGYGSKLVGTDTDTVFTVENTGTDALILTGLPLTITGPNADQFTITVQPTSPIAAAGSTTFTVRFHPTSVGDKTAAISIASNDADENPYILNLTGTGAIPAAALTVTSPNGGEVWAGGSPQAITWTSTGTVGNVIIEYSTTGGGAWTTIVASTANDGTHPWTVPNVPSALCLVRVSETDGSPADVSDAVFTITTGSPVKEDLVGTWDGQAVYYRNSTSGQWTILASPADLIACGDLFGDGKDDVIGIWASQAGVWAKSSADASWTHLSSTARHIAAGDMNGDGRVDFLGTWDGQGVYYRDSISGVWTQLATPADLITAGDLDGDGTDDLIGIWSGQAGVWVKFSQTGNWTYLGSSASDIATADMNGDGRADLLGTWTGQGVFYRNSMNGVWTQLATPADLIAAGDLDGDGTGDLIGIWAGQAGVWVRYSQTQSWTFIASSARDIDAGKMSTGNWISGSGKIQEFAWPMGGFVEGPGIGASIDVSAEGPGGRYFAPQVESRLTPPNPPALWNRIPGPGEPGFRCRQQQNLIPGQGGTERKKIS